MDSLLKYQVARHNVLLPEQRLVFWYFAFLLLGDTLSGLHARPFAFSFVGSKTHDHGTRFDCSPLNWIFNIEITPGCNGYDTGLGERSSRWSYYTLVHVFGVLRTPESELKCTGVYIMANINVLLWNRSYSTRNVLY